MPAAHLKQIRGVPPGMGAFSGKALVIVDFNSIGAGRGSSHEITSPDDYAPGPFAYTMMNSLYATFPNATFGKKNFSVSGRQTPTMISQSGQVDAMFDPATYDRQIIVAGEITNHIADGGASATDAYNSYVSYCKARKAKGFTVVATTVINRTTNFASGMSASEFATRQSAVNALLRANYLQFADALADIATLNLTLPDGTHPGDAGYVTMGNFIAGKVAPLVQVGFNSQSIAYLQSGSTVPTPGTTTPVLLLRGQGANNSTSIIDEGTPVHTMTANNTAKISTTQFKFGSSSIYLDGGTNTHVSTPSSTDFDFGSGDFTMEAWIYKTSAGTGFPGLFARGDNTQNQWVLCWPNAGARLEFYVSSVNGSSSSYTAQGLNTTTDTPLNQWVHIALVRSAGATKLYQNGALIGTATTNTALETVPTGKPLRIGFLPAVGQAQDTGDRFVGYLHARITKSALYTSTFTPPDSFPQGSASTSVTSTTSQYTRHVQTLRGIGSTIQYETESGTYMQINNTNSGITSGLLSLYPIAIPTQSVLTGAMMFVTNAPNFTASTGSTFSLYSYNTSTATYTLVGRTAPNTSLFKPTKASFVTANFESPITTQAGGIYFLGYIYNQDTQSAAPQIAGYTAIVGGNNEDRARLPGTSTYLSATLFASLPPATITFSQIAGAAAPRPWMAVY